MASNVLRTDSLGLTNEVPSETASSLGARLRNIKRIGPYRIRKTIGVGSFSRVMLAVHEPTGQKVAVKVVCREKLESKVQREIEILKLFDHPHIIRLYEVIYTELDVFMIIEYVSGGELFEYLTAVGRMSEDQGRRIFQEIIAAVEYCHARRVVHRDLKPENILIDKHHHVKIADFGLSNIMRDGYFFETSCGSLNYAAPEIVCGNLYAGPEVDVWSCGVILYSLVTGKLPFDDQNVATLFHKIKNGDYSIPGYLSEDAQDLLRRILVTDPVKRISMSEIRRHPFFREKLPLYLSIESRMMDEEADDEINETVVQQVLKSGAQLKWTETEVRKALSYGKDLMMKSAAVIGELGISEEDLLKFRTISISYHIFLDQERKSRKRIEELSLSPSPPAISAISTKRESDVLSSTRQALFQRKRWLLGFSSSEPPSSIMRHLLQTLLYMNFKWKIYSDFGLHAVGTIGKELFVKLKIQLYVTAKHKSSVLDIQKVCGDCCSFLSVCTKLMSVLKID